MSASRRRAPELRWGARTYVMGIINVTPDSFSGDGLASPGRSAAEIVAAAVEQAQAQVAAGADILDVGAESTRPVSVYGAHPAVDPETELALAVPVVSALAAEFGDQVRISIDTTKGVVAREALAAGASIVNDVWAARRDPATAEAAAAAGAYLIVMHNKDVAEYPNGLMPEVIDWLRTAAEAAAARGVARNRLIVDPGIGFGKTPAHSLEVLHRLDELKMALGLPLLVGTSRKRFIGEVLDDAPPDQRLDGTAASVALAIRSGADIVRVHDVAPLVRTVRVADAIVRAGPPAQPAHDRIAILGMTASGRHGVSDEERSAPQPFEVDVTLLLDLARPATTDALADTADYAAVHALAAAIVEQRSFHLIEALAGAIGQAVLDRWPVAAVDVAVRKPRTPLPGPFDSVEAKIRLSRVG